MDSAFGDDGGDLTLERLRDMIVDSFAAQHGPRFGETRAVLGLDDGEEAVLESVRGIVKLAYTLAGGSFERPTTRTTTRVVNLLAERSAVWGVAEEEVFDHHCEIMRQLGRLMLNEAGETARPKD